MRHSKILRNALVAAMFLGASASVYGVKANPRLRTVILPDGTSLTLRLNGDESFHYYSTADGYAVDRADNGFYYYLDANAALSNVKASELSARKDAETQFLSTMDVKSAPEALRASRPRRGLAFPVPGAIHIPHVR